MGLATESSANFKNNCAACPVLVAIPDLVRTWDGLRSPATVLRVFSLPTTKEGWSFECGIYYGSRGSIFPSYHCSSLVS